jgi:hypothetical protein
MMKRLVGAIAVAMLMVPGVIFAQDQNLAPRGARLTGTANYGSARGIYKITFPSPNECIDLPPIKASSRSEALYIAVSKGGFRLLPASGGLTVWTIEEWEDFASSFPEFAKQEAVHCREKKTQ